MSTQYGLGESQPENIFNIFGSVGLAYPYEGRFKERKQRVYTHSFKKKWRAFPQQIRLISSAAKFASLMFEATGLGDPENT